MIALGRLRAGRPNLDRFTTIAALGHVFSKVWSCVLKGLADVGDSMGTVDEGADSVPVIRVSVGKQAAGRWGGFIGSIGEDSILQ